MARHLIIGAVEGYRFGQMAPFFLSLRRVNYQGETVIFHRGIDAESLARLADLGVRLIELPARGLRNPVTGRVHTGQGRFGDVLSLGLRALAHLPGAPALGFAKRFFHIANLRFVMAAQYLRPRLGSYSHVMICDVRDVLFQADPFGFEGVDQLTTILESPGLTIGTSGHYRDWISAAYGAAEAGRFRDARLSCCAITLGPAPEMLRYLEGMARLILRNFTREPYLFGLDSAAHNHLCLHRSLPGLVLRENFEGPAAHLGLAAAEEIRLDAAGRLVDPRGRVIPTVHQYDRHPAVMAALASGGRRP